MPGDSFDPMTGADPNTQDPNQTGVAMPQAPGPVNFKAMLTGQMQQNYEGVNKKYEAQYEILRNASMPDESTIKEDMSAELADLRESYKARDEDVWSQGPKVYKAKASTLSTSYHADQFRIKQKYDKMLREQNRAYDQQKKQLAMQHQSDLAEVDKHNTYLSGHFHAIDEMEQSGSLNSEQAQRARARVLGVNLPAEPDPAQQFSALEHMRTELKSNLSRYSWKDKSLQVTVHPDPTQPGYTETRPATEQEITEWGESTMQDRALQARQINIMQQQGIVPKQARDAANYLGGGGATGSVVGRTKIMRDSMQSPPKTKPPEELGKPQKLTRAIADQYVKLAKGDKQRALQMIQAAGYEE